MGAAGFLGAGAFFGAGAALGFGAAAAFFGAAGFFSPAGAFFANFKLPEWPTAVVNTPESSPRLMAALN